MIRFNKRNLSYTYNKDGSLSNYASRAHWIEYERWTLSVKHKIQT